MVLAYAEGISFPYDDLVLSALSLGHISVAVDPDGAMRRLPLVVRHDDRGHPALVLALEGGRAARTAQVLQNLPNDVRRKLDVGRIVGGGEDQQHTSTLVGGSPQ